MIIWCHSVVQHQKTISTPKFCAGPSTLKIRRTMWHWKISWRGWMDKLQWFLRPLPSSNWWELVLFYISKHIYGLHFLRCIGDDSFVIVLPRVFVCFQMLIARTPNRDTQRGCACRRSGRSCWWKGEQLCSPFLSVCWWQSLYECPTTWVSSFWNA